jgi:DNA topoisomerase III
MTSVLGHITGLDFHDNYRKWQGCAPRELFDAPVITSTATVSHLSTGCIYFF